MTHQEKLAGPPVKIIEARTNYVFIDFENVQETGLDRIAGKPVKVVIVLGERHKNLPVALVKQLLACVGQVQLVETGRSGKNALDLVLACYLGEMKRADPHGYFHILSRDKDFDALIEHLKVNGVRAARHSTISEIPVLMTTGERVQYLIKRFQANQTSRAKSEKALKSQIQALCGNSLSPAELVDTVNMLVSQKIFKITPTGAIVHVS